MCPQTDTSGEAIEMNRQPETSARRRAGFRGGADDGRRPSSRRPRAQPPEPSQDTTALCLWVTSTNNSAVALYTKCGFRRTDQTKLRTRRQLLGDEINYPA